MRTIDRKEDMNTFAERKELVNDLLDDPDFVITAKEKFTFIYHWYRYENALRKRVKAERNVKKYGTCSTKTQQLSTFERR